MPRGNQKGSAFERLICKELSMWWSGGKRDDIFWRTAGSGARATQRRKSGRDTYGQHGDVQAIDPIGELLTDLFSIELKRGYNKINLLELVTKPEKKTGFVEFVNQAERQKEESGTPYWMIIFKRDREMPLVIFDPRVMQNHSLIQCIIGSPSKISIRANGNASLHIIPFSDFCTDKFRGTIVNTATER